MNAATIVGYTYDADVWCPACLVEALIARGVLAPGARGMRVEDALDQGAEYVGVDRYDEHTYDGGEYPKVIFADMADGDVCGCCGGGLT